MEDTDLIDPVAAAADDGWRSRDDRYLAGLFGGLGQRFDLDAGLLRLGAVAVAVALGDDGGAIVPGLYALAWIATASPGERPPIRALGTPYGRREAATAVVCGLLGAVALVEHSLWPAGALAVAAWLLLADRGDTGHAAGTSDGHADTTSASPSSAAETDLLLADLPTDETQHPAGPDSAARWGRTRRGLARPVPELRLPRFARRTNRRRREPALWPLTLALLLGFAVVCATIDNLRSPGLDPAIWVNGALVIVGAVLALSGWRGRAGWTALLLIPLLPLWLAFSASGIGRYDGDGTEFASIATNDRDTWTLEQGYGTLDVVVAPTAVDPGLPVRIDARVTAGRLAVSVPHDVEVVIRSTVGLGAVSVQGEDGSLWRRDDAFVTGGERRTASYPAVFATCWRSTWGADDLTWQWDEARQWMDTELGDAPDFGDPAALDPDDPSTLRARQWFERSFGVVPTWSPAEGLWESFQDDFGEPCDPDVDHVVAGTVEIDATIGLGNIDVQRSS